MPLQEIIHKLTEGTGSRILAAVLVFFGMVGLAVWYDLAAFKNLATIEGMDAAQLARNLSRGEGYTTRFIRPFSLYLTGRQAEGPGPLLGDRHPDLANAPVYPVVLAGALKVMPFPYPDTTVERDFSVYRPDLYIALVNQLFFFVAVWMLFRLARRLLDESAAWVTAAVFAGSDLFWRFSVSGQSTLLLIILFLGLVDVLSRMGPQTRSAVDGGGAAGVGGPGAATEATSAGWLTGMAALAGLLTGLAGLTRYSLGLLIIPVMGFLAGLPAAVRVRLMVACGLTFLGVMAPWVVRNWLVSGTPFGTAGFALFQNTMLFRGFELERALQPDFSLLAGPDLWHKLLVGTREIMEKELPRLGGSWVGAFFLVGLLVPFRKPMLNRLRNLVMGSLALFTLVQALGRTALTTESPELNSENLLVILAPMVFLFGVSLFFMLVDQFGVKAPGFRLLAMSLFIAVASAPLLFTLFMPVTTAVAYPPYYPPYIQSKSQWVGKDDLIMSDFPWAVAWYGERQSVWLSSKYRENVSPKYRNDFYVFDRLGKPIRALYLSARTLKSIDTQALHAWASGAGEENWEQAVSDWESFALLGALLKHEIPTGFPLKRAPFGLLPELFLGDSERNEGKPIKGK
jgi:hypothetical protein